MTFDTIGAFAMMLTPLGAMAFAVFTLLMTRIKRLERENGEILGILISSCSERSEVVEKMATVIAGRGRDG